MANPDHHNSNSNAGGNGEQPQDDNLSDEFNRSGMYMYGVVSGATFSLCFAVFSFAMYMQPDSSAAWLAGTLFGIGSFGAGIYEVVRYAKSGGNPNNEGDGNDNNQTPPMPPQP